MSIRTVLIALMLAWLPASVMGQTVDELLDKGEKLTRYGKLDGAQRAFEEALQREPGNETAIEALAQVTAFRESWHESVLYWAAFQYLYRTDPAMVGSCQAKIDEYSKRIYKGGQLSIVATPDDATISINGLNVGVGKVSLAVMPGYRYVISASKEDYHKPEEIVFTPGGDETKDVSIRLQPIVYMGTVLLKLYPESGVKVYVDAREVGTSPKDIQVEEGRHLICFSKEGYDRWWRAVTIRRNDTLPLEVKMRDTERPDESCDVMPDDF